MASKHRICSVSGCEDKYFSLGFCTKHYQRFKKHGSTETVNTSWSTRSPRPVIERFMENVELIPFSDCWYWTGSIRAKKRKIYYGSMTINYKTVSAHKFAYEYFKGPITNDDMEVMHTCHQGRHGCVNPDHLKLGTSQDNVAGTVEAGNHVKGERCPQAKLNRKKANEIKQLLSEKPSNISMGKWQKTIAAKYDVTKQNINAIYKGKTWK